MPSTYDPLLRLEIQATGENATTWGTKTNNNLELIAAAIAGQTIVSVSSADVSLTEANAAADQSRAAILVMQGTLTGNVNVVVPAQSKTYAVYNLASGAFAITLKNATGTGTVLPTSGVDLIVCTTATCVGLAGSISTQIAAVSAQVSSLDVRTAAVSAQVSALDVRVAAVSASVSALNVQVSNIATSVSALQTQVDAVSAAVSTLNALEIRIIE